MKRSFVATVREILPEETDEVPELARAISYWNEGACRPEEWLRQVKSSWGPAGYAMRRGNEVLGTVIFGPAKFLTRVERLTGEPSSEDTVMMACITGDRRVKKHLLVRMLKDLRQRGVTVVEAIAEDFGAPRHASTHFLLENGWRPVRRIRHYGRPYTLMRTDLGNAVEVGELARDFLGRVRLPKLKNASPVPGGACIEAESLAHTESR